MIEIYGRHSVTNDRYDINGCEGNIGDLWAAFSDN